MSRWACIALALFLARCGAEEGTPPAPQGSSAAGTWRLDVGAWLGAAKADASGFRRADLLNQAAGSDPRFGPDGSEDRTSQRPPPPPDPNTASEEERDAFAEAAQSYVKAEAEALDETLTLAADHTVVLAHHSRAAEGGSVSLGLTGWLRSSGTWSEKDGAVEVTLRESERPAGRKWKLETVLHGTLGDDGTLHIAPLRGGLRDVESVYRRE